MLPANFQSILWSKSIQKIDLKRDKIYFIHQVLSLGSIENIRGLFEIFSKKEIRETFTKNPQKVYTKVSFNFAKNILLDLKDVDEKQYVKTTF